MTTPTEITDRIHDPIHRTSYTFRREGENLWVDIWFEDSGHIPEHFHPSLEEHWEIVDGTARVKLDGHWRELTPEDGPVRVARNIRHELSNTSGREVHARAEVIPAGRLEAFLTESSQAARDCVFNARGMPTSLRTAVWGRRVRAALPRRDHRDIAAPGLAADRPARPRPLRASQPRPERQLTAPRYGVTFPVIDPGELEWITRSHEPDR